MCVDGQVHFLHGVLVLPCYGQLVDYLGGMTTHDVCPENLTVFLVANDLHESFRFTGSPGPAVGAEGEAAHLKVQFALLGLLFRHSDTGDLGVAVGDARYVVVLDRLRPVSGNTLGNDHAFPATLVCQHRRPGDISDGIDTGRGGLQGLLVHLDEAAIGELHPGFLQAEVFRIHRSSRGHQDLFGLDRLALPVVIELEGDLVLLHIRFLDLHPGQDRDPSFLVALGQHVRHFGVLDRQNSGQYLDQGNLGSKRVEDVGELTTDRPGPYDGHRGGRLLQEERFIGADDGGLVDLEPDLRDAFNPRASGDDQRLASLVLILTDLDGAVPAQHTVAFDDRDLVLLHQELDTLRVLFRHLS